MIPVALSTGSVYTYGTARAFELAARAGYDGVELMVDDRWDTRQADYLRGVSARSVPVLSVHSPFGHVSGWPRREVERIRQSLALAEALGARTLNVHLPFRAGALWVSVERRRWMVPMPQTGNHREYARWLVDGGLAALLAGTDVTIAVENLPVRRLLGRRFSPYAYNTWDALEQFPRLCLDSTHCGTTGSDLLAVYERLASRVVHVHLSNYDGTYQHQPVQRGLLPLDRFLGALAARRYTGAVVVELTPNALPMQDERKLAAELERNLAFCRRHLAAERIAPVPAPPGASTPASERLTALADVRA
jgi:sugar phosphate isomerase/epimerase